LCVERKRRWFFFSKETKHQCLDCGYIREYDYSILKKERQYHGGGIMDELTKEQKIEELVTYIVDSMDMSALEDYAKEQLAEYYNSPEGVEDLATNWEEMQEIKGDA